MWVTFGVGDLYIMLLSSCELRENWCSEISTLIKAVSILYIFNWICEKLGAGDSHKNVLNGCQFREDWCSESCALLKSIIEFQSILCTVIV
jgi:hypothetical protein